MMVPGGSSAGPSPQDNARINSYLNQMGQAGRLDQAQKDVEQAMRFLGMRGVEKDVQAGVPYPAALSKHLPYLSYGSPQQAAAYGKIIQQAQPPAPLSMTNVGGVNVLRTPRGDRIVPRNALPQEPITSAKTIPLMDPEGNPVPNYIAVPSAAGRGFVLHPNRTAEPSMTPTQKRLLLNDQIKDKNSELSSVSESFVPEKDKAGRAAKASKVEKLKSDLDALKQQRSGLLKNESPKTGGDSVPAKTDRKIGQVYQTPKGPHKWTANGWVTVQ
jgi:hypothetical protein